MSEINKEQLEALAEERKGRQRYRMSWILGVFSFVLLGYLVYEIIVLFIK